MNAYRCDGCDQHFDLADHEDPPIVITQNMGYMGARTKWHAHSWECVTKIAKKSLTPLNPRP